MPTVKDYPILVGSPDTFELGAGSSKVQAVSQNDGDTSYIFGANGRIQRFVFPNLPGDVGTVQSCTIFARTRDEAVAGPNMFIFNGLSDVLVVTGQGVAYQLRSAPHFSLSPASINSAQLGLAITAGAGIPTYCTEFYRETVYTVVAPTNPGASFMMF